MSFIIISFMKIKVKSITQNLSIATASLLKGKDIYPMGITIQRKEGKSIVSHGIVLGLQREMVGHIFFYMYFPSVALDACL